MNQAVQALERENFRPKLGMYLLVGAETMFFAGLISAFLVFRMGQGEWPPPAQPRLPVAVTAFNTALLLLSAWTLRSSLGSFRRGEAFRVDLALTFVLGTAFLGIQGVEWIRLVGFGLTPSSSVYGGLFYTLIGIHGVHVLAGLLALGWVLQGAMTGPAGRNPGGMEACGIYWNFVVAVWPALYVLVYLL